MMKCVIEPAARTIARCQAGLLRNWRSGATGSALRPRSSSRKFTSNSCGLMPAILQKPPSGRTLMPYSVSPRRKDHKVFPNPRKKRSTFMPNSFAVRKWPPSCRKMASMRAMRKSRMPIRLMRSPRWGSGLRPVYERARGTTAPPRGRRPGRPRPGPGDPGGPGGPPRRSRGSVDAPPGTPPPPPRWRRSAPRARGDQRPADYQALLVRERQPPAGLQRPKRRQQADRPGDAVEHDLGAVQGRELAHRLGADLEAAAGRQVAGELRRLGVVDQRDHLGTQVAGLGGEPGSRAPRRQRHHPEAPVRLADDVDRLLADGAGRAEQRHAGRAHPAASVVEPIWPPAGATSGSSTVRPGRPAEVRSWPQAASMPTPRLARTLTARPWAATRSRKRWIVPREGVSSPRLGVGL